MKKLILFSALCLSAFGAANLHATSPEVAELLEQQNVTTVSELFNRENTDLVSCDQSSYDYLLVAMAMSDQPLNGVIRPVTIAIVNEDDCIYVIASYNEKDYSPSKEQKILDNGYSITCLKGPKGEENVLKLYDTQGFGIWISHYPRVVEYEGEKFLLHNRYWYQKQLTFVTSKFGQAVINLN